MLRINNRGFKRSYVYGGTGIFDSIAKAAVSLLPVVQKGALQVGKKLGEKRVYKRYHLSYLNLEINHQSLRRLNLSRFVQVQRTRSVALQALYTRSVALQVLRTRSVALQDLLQNLRTYYENTQLLHHHLRNRILT